MDKADVWQDMFYFVPLQVPNQMPLDVTVGELFLFVPEDLRAILANDFTTCVDQVPGGFGIDIFRDTYQLDLGRRTSCPLRSVFNTLVDFSQVLR